jgi:hypothetical protein
MDYYEQVDYMTQLASDMSLDDGSGLYWNIGDFEPVIARISELERIVNEYLVHHFDDSPKSSARIEDGDADSEFVSSSYASQHENMMYDREDTVQAQNNLLTNVNSNTYDVAIAKLNWYKNKIVDSIETAETSEVKNQDREISFNDKIFKNYDVS